MDPCHSPRPLARQSFILSAYRADAKGRMAPRKPERCVAGGTADVRPCQVWVQHWRARKTGPRHPVLVAKCRTHKKAFTVYPPGHVPYGRRAMAPVDASGQPVRQAADIPIDSLPASPAEPPLSWDLTSFCAALDGAQGKPWPRLSVGAAAVGGWRTQGRWIAAAAQIFGLPEDSLRVPLVGLVGIPALTLREARSAWAQATGFQTRGDAIGRVLAALNRLPAGLLDWLLTAGWMAGRWGRAWMWDPMRGVLRDVCARARSP